MCALEHCNSLLTPFEAMKKWMPYFKAFTRLGIEVDDSDLCFIGEHPLRKLLGVRTEEIDVHPENMDNHILYQGESYPIRKKQ